MFVSVCISLYLSICQYLFICLYLCTSFRSSSQGSNSQQQYGNSLAVTAVTAACFYLSISSISLHICLYQTYIRTYMHIFVHICKYRAYLAQDQSQAREQISPEPISGTSVYQTYVCAYILISGHICLYPKT